MNTPLWPALAAARRAVTPRVPFIVGGRRAGSVAFEHLGALAAFAPQLVVEAGAVALSTTLADAAARSAALAPINRALRDAGLIVAWRDETYPVLARAGEPVLALIERAASRFWGTLTFGAHCNGYVADASGRPTHLWIARRALSKATDPGLLDNLVGGGVPHGQTPFETLVREGFEEAGLGPARMRGAQAASVIELACDIREGFMHEHLHVFDLRLPADVTPVNQDGEVAELRLMPIAQALALAATGAMTVDASLATLDFALRHRLFSAADHDRLAARMAALFVGS